MLARIVLTGLLIAPWAWNQEVPTAAGPKAWTADLPSVLIQRGKRLLGRNERQRVALQLLAPGRQENEVCSVRLLEIEPDDSAVIRTIRPPDTTARMPEARMPAPPCPKVAASTQPSSPPEPN